MLNKNIGTLQTDDCMLNSQRVDCMLTPIGPKKKCKPNLKTSPPVHLRQGGGNVSTTPLFIKS